MARTNVENVEFYVPIGKREIIRQHAKDRGLTVSEYLRQLVEADMRKHKQPIDLSVTATERPTR